jgi:endonuclease YncB( thermonuclease family)
VCCQLPKRTHPTAVPKGQYEFIVERVIDGDTVLGSIGERRFRVRLSLIDAPEYSQRYGKEAAQALRNMMGSKVQLTVEGVDKYERILGTAIDMKESNVALELVRQGLAWCYPFSRVNSKYDRALCEKTMEQAEKQRLGIWSTRATEPPWIFRRKKRSQK